MLNALDSKSQPKWFMTPGDHDVNPLNWTPDSPDRCKEQYFKSLYARYSPKAAQNLYYGFDINGYHFVVLYSLEHLNTDPPDPPGPRWGNVYSKISDAQLEWLKKYLAAADTSKGVIVFTHHPLLVQLGLLE